MPSLIEKPLVTKMYEHWDSFTLDQGSTFIHGASEEERSIHPPIWEFAADGVDFLKISSFENLTKRDFSRCSVEIDGSQIALQLRSENQLRDFFLGISSNTIYLDITGLSHHVWAPLLKAAIATSKQVYVVYVEPRTYTFSRTPTEAEIFDLSEAIHGISPLPGFTILSEPEDEESVLFVTFLGFEGHRLAYVLEQVQPPGKKIIPIIGVPGFMPVFPFHTYLGNRNILAQGTLHSQIKHIVANSAFDAFYVLQQISADYSDHVLKIAPIGTKPHALGAVLFTLWTNRSVEIVYDHPIWKPSRTIGSANILLYEINQLFLDSTT